MKEILDLAAPDARMNDLNVWHLERMAVGEYESDTLSSSSGDIAIIKKECRQSKELLKKILANAKKFETKREQVVQSMIKQRDTLIEELDKAKEFMTQLHTSEQVDVESIQLGLPIPVEERLLSVVKPPESAPSIDLSEAPAI